MGHLIMTLFVIVSITNDLLTIDLMTIFYTSHRIIPSFKEASLSAANGMNS